jgi:hypothetical protein
LRVWLAVHLNPLYTLNLDPALLKLSIPPSEVKPSLDFSGPIEVNALPHQHALGDIAAHLLWGDNLDYFPAFCEFCHEILRAIMILSNSVNWLIGQSSPRKSPWF